MVADLLGDECGGGGHPSHGERLPARSCSSVHFAFFDPCRLFLITLSLPGTARNRQTGCKRERFWQQLLVKLRRPTLPAALGPSTSRK